MAVVVGVDFGTLSVRASVVDSERGLLASAIAEYPLHRKREDPEYATQSHEDHMCALAAATREAEARGAGTIRFKPFDLMDTSGLHDLVTELLSWFGGMEAQPLDELSRGVEEKPETDRFLGGHRMNRSDGRQENSASDLAFRSSMDRLIWAMIPIQESDHLR